MKRIIVWIIILLMVFPALAEDEVKPLYSMSKALQGRIRPGKRNEAIVSFDMWTELYPTGRTTADRTWVEVRSSEGDLVWCSIDYLTERRTVIHVYTLWENGVKIRSKPGNGKVTGTAKREQILEITQVVMGYGRCQKGWVDLEYFIEDCD